MSQNRPGTPSTISTFSLTSTMDHRVFRDDGGRQYQATNDDYALPADETELDRLNVQHKVLKVMQDDKNYVAPMDVVLKAEEGREGRVLDVGAGSGIWAVEIAQEFPHAQVLGIDLSPVQYQHDIPDNCQFTREDATQGLPYPDGHFDVVHLRALVAGIRDWPALVNEAVRVTAPGGLVVFVESAGVFRLLHSEAIGGEGQVAAPGFMKFSALFDKALTIRGMDTHAALASIPNTLERDERVGPVTSVRFSLPMTAWSKDPKWRKAGEIMVADTKEVPATVRLLITDACELSSAEYDQVAKDYHRDLFEKNAPAVVQAAHVWAQKL